MAELPPKVVGGVVLLLCMKGGFYVSAERMAGFGHGAGGTDAWDRRDRRRVRVLLGLVCVLNTTVVV